MVLDTFQKSVVVCLILFGLVALAALVLSLFHWIDYDKFATKSHTHPSEIPISLHHDDVLVSTQLGSNRVQWKRYGSTADYVFRPDYVGTDWNVYRNFNDLMEDVERAGPGRKTLWFHDTDIFPGQCTIPPKEDGGVYDMTNVRWNAESLQSVIIQDGASFRGLNYITNGIKITYQGSQPALTYDPLSTTKQTPGLTLYGSVWITCSSAGPFLQIGVAPGSLDFALYCLTGSGLRGSNPVVHITAANPLGANDRPNFRFGESWVLEQGTISGDANAQVALWFYQPSGFDILNTPSTVWKRPSWDGADWPNWSNGAPRQYSLAPTSPFTYRVMGSAGHTEGNGTPTAAGLDHTEGTFVGDTYLDTTSGKLWVCEDNGPPTWRDVTQT